MIYFLPGMGANSNMYTQFPEWQNLQGCRFLNWPGYEGEKSIKDLALKIIKTHGISRCDFICGSSLGGMVALEISAILNCQKAVLIGSACSRDEVNQLLLWLAPLAKITPLSLMQKLTGKSNSSLLEMFSETDSRFIKSMCSAIQNWQGRTGFKQLYRIHGTDDMIIKCPDDAFKIKGGGHLIAMTHPEECTNILKSLFETL